DVSKNAARHKVIRRYESASADQAGVDTSGERVNVAHRQHDQQTISRTKALVARISSSGVNVIGVSQHRAFRVTATEIRIVYARNRAISDRAGLVATCP